MKELQIQSSTELRSNYDVIFVDHKDMKSDVRFRYQ